MAVAAFNPNRAFRRRTQKPLPKVYIEVEIPESTRVRDIRNERWFTKKRGSRCNFKKEDH